MTRTPGRGQVLDLIGRKAAQWGPDRLIAELAARQHGVVAAAQLLELGLTRRMTYARVAAGRLHRVHRGVYAVGHSNLTREAAWLAAVLACGAGAVLSHCSAAALWRIRASAATLIDISSPTRIGRSRPGLRVHRWTLAPDEVTELGGIPCTTVARTVLDLATVVSPGAVEYAIHRGQSNGLLDLGELSEVLVRHRGRPGTGVVGSILGWSDLPAEANARSTLERRFIRLCRGAGIPSPRVNAWIPLPIPAGGLEVDFSWPEGRLVVETDGLRNHRTARAMRRDPGRDRALTLAGWTVMRYTWRDITDAPERVPAELREALGLHPRPD